MNMTDTERDLNRWRSAVTLYEMAELTARFIEGSSSYFPGFAADRVDEETASIAGYLVRLNRAGCMTVMSQPGMSSGGRNQRAVAAGFASEAIALKIARLSLYADLLVVVVPAENSVGLKTPVIIDENQPRGWMGVPSNRDFGVYEHVLTAEARNELEESWSVTLIDLAWGREDHLWRLLDEAIDAKEGPHPEISLVPHPEMGMQTDYFC